MKKKIIEEGKNKEKKNKKVPRKRNKICDGGTDSFFRMKIFYFDANDGGAGPATAAPGESGVVYDDQKTTKIVISSPKEWQDSSSCRLCHRGRRRRKMETSPSSLLSSSLLLLLILTVSVAEGSMLVVKNGGEYERVTVKISEEVPRQFCSQVLDNIEVRRKKTAVDFRTYCLIIKSKCSVLLWGIVKVTIEQKNAFKPGFFQS